MSGFAVEGIGLGKIRTPKPGQVNRAVLADFEWAAIRLCFQTSRVAFPVLRPQRRLLSGGGCDKEVGVMRRREGVPVHLFADDAALAATLVSAGVAAILTSISLTGFSVQAWVT